MKYLKRINENNINDIIAHEKRVISEFCEDCLVNLLDNSFKVEMFTWSIESYGVVLNHFVNFIDN